MVGLGGLEPPTSPLSGVRSNQLSYRPEEETLYALHLSLERKKEIFYSIYVMR